MSKMYICILDEFPDYMVPTLVAHAVLGAHLKFTTCPEITQVPFRAYNRWLEDSFKKCVVRVNEKEFNKICALPDVYVGHEKNTLDGRDSCVVVCPRPDDEIPNVLKFAKLWSPK